MDKTAQNKGVFGYNHDTKIGYEKELTMYIKYAIIMWN